jgi:hypothetical protein
MIRSDLVPIEGYGRSEPAHRSTATGSELVVEWTAA